MGLAGTPKEELIGFYIRDILEETMGEDYMMQIAKRKMLCKEDKLLESLRRIENLIQWNIFNNTRK